MNHNQKTDYYHLKTGDIFQYGDIYRLDNCGSWWPVPAPLIGCQFVETPDMQVRRRVIIGCRYAFYSTSFARSQKTSSKRDALISDDDILNLKIALETSETMEEFLDIT